MNATLINPFKVYVPSEREVVGTVGSMIPNGKLKLIPGTIARYEAGTNKAIGVILLNKAGESTTLPCSKKVSATVVSALANGKTKAEVLSAIAKLEITEYENNKTHEMQQTISAPIGEAGMEEELSIVAANKSTVTYEDLA